MKLLVTAALFLYAIVPCLAQDLIIKKSGDTVQAKVLDASTAEIRYRKPGQNGESSYVLLQSAVKQINYDSGRIDSFVVVTRMDSATLPDATAPYKAGKQDAHKYYRNYRAASTFVFFSELLTPLGGLIPAIACSATPPKTKHLRYPNPDLMQNEAYASGYRQEARKMKNHNIWSSWGYAFSVNILLGLIVFSRTR